MCGPQEVNHLSELWLPVSKAMGAIREVKQIPCEAPVVDKVQSLHLSSLALTQDAPNRRQPHQGSYRIINFLSSEKRKMNGCMSYVQSTTKLI